MNNSLSAAWIIALASLAIWELAWKGVALWMAGRNNHRGWFIALLLINSISILPIIYWSMHREIPDFERMEVNYE